jgi:hypothetical protein
MQPNQTNPLLADAMRAGITIILEPRVGAARRCISGWRRRQRATPG